MKFVAVCSICVAAAMGLAADAVIYQDGLYTGSGKGKKGPVPVTVVIADGRITKVTPGENKEYHKRFKKVLEIFIPSIIRNQSTGVDMVSGATLSCKGVVAAVNEALLKAVKTKKADNE